MIARLMPMQTDIVRITVWRKAALLLKIIAVREEYHQVYLIVRRQGQKFQISHKLMQMQKDLLYFTQMDKPMQMQMELVHIVMQQLVRHLPKMIVPQTVPRILTLTLFPPENILEDHKYW